MSRRSPRPRTRKQAGCAGIQPETDRLARSYLDLLCQKEAVRRQSRRDAGLEGADNNAGKAAADVGPDLPNSLPIRPDLAVVAILTARAIEQEDGLADKLSAGQPVLVIKTGDKEHVPLAGTVASSCCISADRKVRYSNTKRKGSGECIVIEAKDARRTSVSLFDDDVLEALGAGCSLVGISPDPEMLLPRTLLRAADHRICLPKLDASAIRLTIATLIGAVPEAGISDDIAARLDVTDLAVAVRPGRTADDCIAVTCSPECTRS